MSTPYEEGFEAAMRGEEAAPGCTAGEAGQEWLRGYLAGAAARGATAEPRPRPAGPALS